MSAQPPEDRIDAEGAHDALLRRWPHRREWLESDGGARRYPRLEHARRTPTGRRSRVRSAWLRQPDAIVPPAPNSDRFIADASGSDGREEVEVAHEALIRHWPRLKDWLEQDRSALLLRESVREAAQEWEQHGRDESYLAHRGRRLDEAAALRQHPRLDLNALERAYLDAALNLREREEQERETQRQRELAAERERAELAEVARREAEQRVAEQAVAGRRLRRRFLVAAALGVVALLAAGYAFYNFREAEEQRADAFAQRVVAEERGAAALAAAGTAEAERGRADQQAATAQAERAAAVAAAGTAAAESTRADAARREADRQATIARARSLAAEASRQHAFGRDELGALLARQAYLFGQRSGEPLQAQSDEALREALGVDHFSRVLAGKPSWTVEISPDGRWLVTGGLDTGVLVRDLTRPAAPPLALNAPEDATFVALAFSPDSRTLAAGSAGLQDWAIRLWNLDQPNAPPRVLRGHEAAVSSLAFTPNGQTLASGSHDGTVRLWTPDDPTAPIVLRGHDDAVRAIAISPNGRQLASGSHDNTIRLWNLGQPDAKPEVLDGHTGWVVSVAFAPDGMRLASASFDGTIRLWNPSQPDAAATTIDQLSVDRVAFSPDGRTLATGGADGMIRLRDPSQPDAEPTVLTGHEGNIDIAFSPDGARLASTGIDGTVRLWELGEPVTTPKRLTGFARTVSALAIAPDGNTLAAGGWNDGLQLWNLVDPAVPPVSLEEAGVEAVAISPDGRTLASGNRDGGVRLWNLTDLTASPTVLEFDGTARALSFSRDGAKLAVAGVNQSRTVQVWDVTRPEAAPTLLTGLDRAAHSIAFSPDGFLVVVGGEYGLIRQWDLRRPGEPSVSLPGQAGQVYAVAFSPDGRTLAAGGCGIKEITENRECPAGELRLFDLTHPGERPTILSGHQGAVYDLVFSEDGTTLAGACGDGMVRLWDLRQPAAAPIVLSGAGSEVHSVAFSPDDRTLAAGERDGTIWLWPARTEVLADLVCEQTWRNLTRAEWDQYVGAGVPYERTCPDLPSGVGPDGATPTVPAPLVLTTRQAT